MAERPTAGSLQAAARRNLLILAAGMAALYGMVELVFGAAAITFEQTGGSDSLTGLAPAIFLVCAALAALGAGRVMDRRGRRPVLAAGFAIGAAGCVLAALGVRAESLVPVLFGFALTGVATGALLLSRAAAADMFPRERQPRAIALVLFGAVFGALLGPLVFGPLLGDGSDASGLDLAWLGGAGFMVVGVALALRLDPEPREIAAALAQMGEHRPPGVSERPMPLASLREVASQPGVPLALAAAWASLAGMAAAMSLVGTALSDHGHDHSAIFPVLAAHFVGMFAFFAVVGQVIERIGRPRSIAAGLALLAASCGALVPAIESIHLAALVLFGVGLGWSLSFVAATAELAERVQVEQRASVIGLGDLLGNMTGAALVVVGGFALEEFGVAAIAIGAGALPLVTAAWVLRGEAASAARA